MIQLQKHFILSPGGENTGGNSTQAKESDKKESSDKSSRNKEGEHPSLLKKVKDALKDWAEDDQRDLDFDDTRV